MLALLQNFAPKFNLAKVSVTSFKFGFGWQRWLLFIPAILILLATIRAAGWFAGDSIAANAPETDAATAAIDFAPDDAAAHFAWANTKANSFDFNELPLAVGAYERAAALSPNDFRYWAALGKMRERVGDEVGAEKAVRKSVELAPNYTQVRWQFGNILLRRDKRAEAVAELRRATDSDPRFAPYFINLVAQFTPREEQANLPAVVGDSIPVRAALVNFYATDKNFDRALETWQKLPDKEKREAGEQFYKTLLANQKFRTALAVKNQTGASQSTLNQIGQFTNGDFESDALDAGTTTNEFYWQIAAGAQPVIAFDQRQKHNGARSLIMDYNSISGADFRGIAQTLAVEPNTKYQLELWAKTADWKSGSPFYWEIVGANNQVLSKTNQIAAGNIDWQMLSAQFAVADQPEAVTVRLARATCAIPPCAVIGKVWFDDFNLKKIR